MDISEFLVEYPVPPPIKRGERERLSISLDKTEFELLEVIAYHPKMHSIYKRQLGAVVRHALYWFAQAISATLDNDQQAPIIELQQYIKMHTQLCTKEAILEALDTESSIVNLLLDNDDIDGALAEYNDFLDAMATLGRLAGIILKYLFEHPGITTFRQRVMNVGRQLDLQIIEEKPR
jgi:hypothetical protein